MEETNVESVKFSELERFQILFFFLSLYKSTPQKKKEGRSVEKRERKKVEEDDHVPVR